MTLAENKKILREGKDLMQKEVTAEIGLKPAHYSKIEKGFVEPSVEVLNKLDAFYGVSIDDIVHLEMLFSKQLPWKINRPQDNYGFWLSLTKRIKAL